MFETICVGYDGSEPSDRAVRLACDLAGKYGSDVHIVHTPHMETIAFAMGAVTGYHVATTMPSPEETAKSASIVIERAVNTASAAGCVNITTHIGTGDAAQTLIDYAQSVGADLIVTGRRGLGNLSAMVLGSTSQSVGRLAECAHLTVK